MTRVIGVSGSPHRRGNTETLLDAFLDGAREAGAEVEKVVLSTLAYTPCRGCNLCHRTGICVVKDDAVPLLERMAEADVLAVASPIYSMGVTAELKGLIDRAQYLWARRFVTNTLDYSPEHLARLAQAFYRPDVARERATGGVGLGMYLCRLVAQAHGGQFEVRNAQPGLSVKVTLLGDLVTH